MLKTIKVKILYFIMNKVGKNLDLKKLEPVPSLGNKIQNFLLKPFVDRNALNKIILGPISAKLLHSGYNIGVFHYLAASPGATLQEIATQLNMSAYSAEILLNGLEALKLVQKVGKTRYYNTLSSMILVQDFNDKFLSKLMNYVNNVLSPAMTDLQASFTENKPMGLYKIFGKEAKDYYFELSKHEEYNKYFVPFMSAFSQINIPTIARSPVFSNVRKLLDIGGNIGDMAISIAKHHPTINITVYDHPSMAEQANQRFKEEHWDARLNAIGGDFLVDDFPTGYDGLLFSHVIDIFCEETNKKLFQNAFKSLSSKGRIFIFTPVVHGDHDNSYTYKVYNAYFLCLANGKGQFYPPEKIVKWVKEVGFDKVETQYLPCNEILITGTKLGIKGSQNAREGSTEKKDIPIFS
ncbi:MAG: methyltransferase [Gammaproteobacteria bacterium]